MNTDRSSSKKARKSAVLQFLIGYSSKKSYVIYVCLLYSFVIFCYIYAYSTYEGYNFLRKSVSSLGIPQQNPEGALIWNIGMGFAGVGLGPYIMYLFRLYRPIARKTTNISTTILFISAIGVLGVGIFSEDLGLIHYIFASLAFFGFFPAFSFNLYTLAKSRKDGNGWPKLWHLIVIYSISDLIMLGFLTAFVLYWLYYFWGIFWFNPHLPLWEWILLGSYVVRLIVILGIVREKSHTHEQ